MSKNINIIPSLNELCRQIVLLIPLTLSLLYFLSKMCKFLFLQLFIRNELYLYAIIISDHVCLNSLLRVLAFVIVYPSLVFKLLVVPELIHKLIEKNLVLKVHV